MYGNQGTAPLPLAGSGGLYDIATAQYDYLGGRRRRKYSLDSGLVDAGIDPTTGKLYSQEQNPYGGFQRIERESGYGSADNGFGFSGRQQGLLAAQPRYELKRGVQDAQTQYALANQDAAAAYRMAVTGAGRKAAQYGTQTEYQRRFPGGR